MRKEIYVNTRKSMKDISKKMDTIDKLKDIEEGYFYLLEDVYIFHIEVHIF